MVRRTFAIASLVTVALACLATPAFAATGVDTRLTVVPPHLPALYRWNVDITGTLTAGGLPLAGETVQVGTLSGGVFTAVVSAKTGADGSYSAPIRPTVTATWTAVWGDVQGDDVAVPVAPRVSLALSHLQSGTRLTEIFTGAVAPGQSGLRVLVQKATGTAAWQTVASGRLDDRSHYRIAWRLAYTTATYKVRVVLPAYADYAQGTSQKATVQVKVRRG